MMASIGEMKMSSIVDDLAIGLADVPKQMLVLLRNITTKNKDALLSKITFSCVVSNVFNYVREGTESMNRLSQAINFKATKIPEFNAIKLGPMIKDWLRNALKKQNIEEYINEDILTQIEQSQNAPQPASAAPALQGGAQTPAPPQGAPMPPAPAAIPSPAPGGAA
jgi:hypothetical protein